MASTSAKVSKPIIEKDEYPEGLPKIVSELTWIDRTTMILEWGNITKEIDLKVVLELWPEAIKKLGTGVGYCSISTKEELEEGLLKKQYFE